VKNLSDFMYQTFIKAKALDPKDMDSIVTYENSLRLKAPKRVFHMRRGNFLTFQVIHVSAELKNAGKQNVQAEEELFLNYINEYELYDHLFLTIQDMFFNPQVPNPIPIVSFKMEYQSYKFQLKEVPSERVNFTLFLDEKYPSLKRY